jgi:hypothetical protein
MLVSHKGSSPAWEMESIAVLVSACGDAEGLVRKVALLEGELMAAHRAWEKALEKVCNLSNSLADAVHRLVVSETEHREQFREISFLWAWGAELCLTIVSLSTVKSPLMARMRVTTLHRARVVEELTVIRATVSSAVELVLGCSPGEASRVEVMNELTTKFQKLKELCSWPEGPGMRICSLLLGPPPNQACWANRLGEAAG